MGLPLSLLSGGATRSIVRIRKRKFDWDWGYGSEIGCWKRWTPTSEVLHKWTECHVGPVERQGDLPMTFVISTDEVDRHGGVIQAQGWQLDAYLNNPVFLWAHDYSRPVIGGVS